MAATVVGAVAADNNGAAGTNPTVTLPTTGATAIADGDVVVLLPTALPADAGTPTPTGGTGWRELVATQTQGTIKAAVHARTWRTGDPTTLSAPWSAGSRFQTIAAVWLRGTTLDALSAGVVTARASTTSRFSYGAPVEAAADELVLTLGWERTTATETALTSLTGADLVLFKPGNGDASNSVVVAQRTTTAAGATPQVEIQYPNGQNTNAAALQLRAPTAQATAPTTPPATPTASPWVSSTAPTALQCGWLTTNLTAGRASARLASAPDVEVAGADVVVAASGWATARLTGLQADTAYRVVLLPTGSATPLGAVTARTTAATLRRSVVVTSSCQRTGSDHVVFDRLRAEGADFFAHQGDIHYADTGVEATWRDAFARSLTAPRMAALLATTAMPFAWDNHDTGGNGSNGTDPWAGFAPAAVRELMGTADQRSSKGLERTWVHAGVRYVQPDRWAYRDDQDDASTATKTMFGAEQLAWFLDLLSNAPEPVIVWLSGFPLYDIASGRWGSYPVERNKIRDHIAALPAAQRAKIVAVGGDSHAVHADSGANALFGVPSLNASPLDQSGGLPSATWDIGNINVPDDRGYFSRLTFDPAARVNHLRMTWDAVQDDGAVVMTWSKDFPTGSSPWSRWDGTREVRLDLAGVWDGAAIRPLTFDSLAPVGAAAATTYPSETTFPSDSTYPEA